MRDRAQNVGCKEANFRDDVSGLRESGHKREESRKSCRLFVRSYLWMHSKQKYVYKTPKRVGHTKIDGYALQRSTQPDRNCRLTKALPC